MRKNLKILGMVLPLVLSAASFAEEIKGPKASDALNFDSISTAKTSISQKMLLFEMPAEYNCPLFSNSPYMEVLAAVDKMQENFNATFPQCDTKAQNDKLIQKATELAQTVEEAKRLQESGQTFKLELTAEKMANAAQKIQEALAVTAQSQTKLCYRSNQQFRSSVFSINETFQGIAPVILDIVAKNPALGGKLGPAVKILAGADSLSKGLGFVEQIMNDSVMFNMEDPQNRVNTLKNTCQYMKLYRRLEYMRKLKLGQIQSVYSQFQSRITSINQNISEYRKKTSLTMTNVAAAPVTSNAAETTEVVMQDPNDLLYASLRNLLPDELKKLQRAQFDLEQAAKDLKRPKVAQCEIVQTAKNSIVLKKTMEKLFTFSTDWGQTGAPEAAATLESLNAKLTAYDSYFATSLEQKNLEECVDLGEDWIKITLELLSQGQNMVHHYAQELADISDEEDQVKAKRLSRKERDKQNEQTNLASLKSMMQYAAFESGEVEKRAKDMHRYFFRGPKYNEIKAACDKGEDCGYEWVASGLKAAYQWKRNDGPIYEFLLNDDKHFFNAYYQMIQARGVLSRFEYEFAVAEANGNLSGPNYQAMLNRHKKYSNDLTHLSLKYVKKGSPKHIELCDNARKLLDKYLLASTHLMSSQSMCDMIYPALNENNVASKLKQYCVPTAGRVEELDKPSKLQEHIMLLVGRGENAVIKPATGFLAAPLIRDSVPQAVDASNESSPKALVDKLIEKYDNLECEQKSGF